MLLPLVISKSQSAFVSERQISDNILIAYKLTHFLHWKTRRKYGFMLVKLDISKAYDRWSEIIFGVH